jgi:hypothetical protein
MHAPSGWSYLVALEYFFWQTGTQFPQVIVMHAPGACAFPRVEAMRSEAMKRRTLRGCIAGNPEGTSPGLEEWKQVDGRCHLSFFF